jgi:hypothetical protein
VSAAVYVLSAALPRILGHPWGAQAGMLHRLYSYYDLRSDLITGTFPSLDTMTGRLYIALSSMDYANTFTARLSFLSGTVVAVIALFLLGGLLYRPRTREAARLKPLIVILAVALAGYWFYFEYLYEHYYRPELVEPLWLMQLKRNLSFGLGAPVDGLAAGILFAMILTILVRKLGPDRHPPGGFRACFSACLGRVIAFYLVINFFVIVLFSVYFFVLNVLGDVFAGRLLQSPGSSYFFAAFDVLHNLLYLGIFFLYLLPYIIVVERTSLRESFSTLVRFWKQHTGKALFFYLVGAAVILVPNVLVPAALYPLARVSLPLNTLLLECCTAFVSIIIMTAALKFYLAYRPEDAGPLDGAHY